MRTGRPDALLRNDLHTLADKWPTLKALVAPAPSADRTGPRRPPESVVPLNLAAIDLMGDVTSWAHFLSRTLRREVRIPTGTHTTAPWSPPFRATTPRLLRAIADHVGHFTASPDALLAAGVCDEADRLATRARTLVSPTGRRTITTRLRCARTHDGHRCPGYYTAALDPETPWATPDLHCSTNPEHAITPDEWQRAYRRTAHNPDAAARYIAHLKDRVTT